MKKIFIITGEPSGDKLASTVISKIKKNRSDIEYLSVGGSHLNKLGIKSIYELKEVTYIGFTSVILNLFKIRNKINETVKSIIEFNPDILFSVDSPDFTLRIAEKVKKSVRDGAKESFKEDITKELGDVLRYISALAGDLGITLQEVADTNKKKLEDRLQRNQIHGDGDER